MAEAPDTIDLNYVKSPAFREVACDGAIGGPTPTGKIWVAFFTDRFPLPRITRHKIIPVDSQSLSLEPDGEVIEGKDGIVRNVEFGVYLSLDAAEQLYHWLGQHIENLREKRK